MSVLRFLQYLLMGGCLLSLPRFVEFFLNQKFLTSRDDFWVQAFMGLRFDLLVLSFFLLPLLMLFLVHRLVRYRKITAWLGFVDVFIFCAWVFIAVIYFFNFLYLNSYQDRIWKQDWTQAVGLLQTNPSLEIIISLVGACSVLWLGFLLFKNIRKLFLSASLVSLWIMFLILAFFARGSLARDHLRRNHCDHRPNSVVRALCLNPIYVFSKTKNQEFGP